MFPPAWFVNDAACADTLELAIAFLVLAIRAALFWDACDVVELPPPTVVAPRRYFPILKY